MVKYAYFWSVVRYIMTSDDFVMFLMFIYVFYYYFYLHTLLFLLYCYPVSLIYGFFILIFLDSVSSVFFLILYCLRFPYFLLQLYAILYPSHLVYNFIFCLLVSFSFSFDFTSFSFFPKTLHHLIFCFPQLSLSFLSLFFTLCYLLSLGCSSSIVSSITYIYFHYPSLSSTLHCIILYFAFLSFHSPSPPVLSPPAIFLSLASASSIFSYIPYIYFHYNSLPPILHCNTSIYFH